MLVDDVWLLDATLDQANKKEWPRSMRVGPLAVRLSENLWAERGSTMVRTNGCRCGSLHIPGSSGLPMPATPGHRTGSHSPIKFFERGGGRRDQLTKPEGSR